MSKITQREIDEAFEEEREIEKEILGNFGENGELDDGDEYDYLVQLGYFK